MFEQFIPALALMLVFEGLLPFVYPSHWRNMMRSILGQSDRFLRGVGLVCMVVGALVLYIYKLFV